MILTNNFSQMQTSWTWVRFA